MEELRQWITELATLPTGCLIERGSSIAYQYYDHGDKRWNDVSTNLVLQNQIKRAQELEELIMPQLELLKNSEKKMYDMICSYIKEERRRALAEYMVSIKPYPEQHTIYTLHGDFVCSKSEALMSMLLDERKIKYYYEKPKKLGKRIVFPDFTMLLGKGVCYWEHMGRMNDPKYREMNERKLELYRRHNIILGDQLFCTYESDETFDIIKIRRELMKFIESKM